MPPYFSHKYKNDMLYKLYIIHESFCVLYHSQAPLQNEFGNVEGYQNQCINWQHAYILLRIFFLY